MTATGAMLFASGDEGSLRRGHDVHGGGCRPMRQRSLRREGYRTIGERYTAERVRVAYLKVFAGTT